MFKKNNKLPKSPYPRQQYESASTSTGANQGTYPMNPSSYPQPVAPYPYVPVTHQSAMQTYNQPAPEVQPSAPVLPSYGEPPPAYSLYAEKPGVPDHQTPPQQYTAYPQQAPYPQPSPYPQQPGYQSAQQPQYPGYSGQSNYNPAQPAPYPTQPIPQTVLAVGGFDAGARFNAGAAPVIPPAPPGVVPNAAQMAASQGHNVMATQRSSNWFTGGTGGGPIF